MSICSSVIPSLIFTVEGGGFSSVSIFSSSFPELQLDYVWTISDSQDTDGNNLNSDDYHSAGTDKVSDEYSDKDMDSGDKDDDDDERNVPKPWYQFWRSDNLVCTLQLSCLNIYKYTIGGTGTMLNLLHYYLLFLVFHCKYCHLSLIDL